MSLPASDAATRDTAPPVETSSGGPRAPRRRRMSGWIAIGIVILLVGGIGGALAALGQWSARDALDPESAGPLGTRAVVELLRDRGVEVVVARDRFAASDALLPGPATLVLPDAPALSDEALDTLAGNAADVVLIEPRARDLRLLLPGAEPAGVGDGDAVPPECAFDGADRAGAVAPGAVFDATGRITACYPSGSGHGLLVGDADDADGRASALDGRALLTNETLADDGNAALALNLMGRHPVVVWYVPSLADSDLAPGAATLGELTPRWVSPVIVLLLVTAIAAGIWRGRRFGPLVAERLPVTVRASETTEGRGRLYGRSRDALHAADQLRIGVVERLAGMLALGPGATAGEVADAAAQRAGIDRGAVRRILIDDIPGGDRDLVTLRRHLRDLESAVRTAIRSERYDR